jgi:mercuric ion transport protein
MDERKLLGWSVAGTLIAAVCCFTPILVVLLGAIGLSAWLAGLDYVLLAALVGFAALTVYALGRKSRAAAERAE